MSTEIAQLLPRREWADPQAQMLEDTWLLTLFAVLLAIALPWFVSAFNIDFAAASWAMLALGGVYLSLGLVTGARLRSAAVRQRTLVALHSAGIVGLGLLWQRGGGAQDPVFLLAFVLPVIGASALSRWQPYISAALALLVVSAVALSQTPELRWYASELHVSEHWVRALLGSSAQSSGAGPLPGFYAPVSYDVVLLEVFGVLIFACAVAAESLSNSFERLLDHLTVARTQAALGQEMWSTLLLQLPLPALLVDAETLQVVLAGEHLASFHAAGTELIGRSVVEAIGFSYPERVQELIRGNGGSIEAVVVHTDERVRVVTVRVRHLLHEERRLALMLLEDTTATLSLEAALDAQESPALVIDAHGRVLVASRGARAFVPLATPGANADEALLPSDAPPLRARANGAAPRWWEPGFTGRRRVQVMLADREYQALCTAVALPGEQEALYVVSLSPSLATTGRWLGIDAGPDAPEELP
jgi:hypothetical protein